MLSRRSLLAGGLALSAFGLLARPGRAAVARALSLAELVGGSAHVLAGVAGDAFGQWETIGDRDRIVTYTTYRVDQTLDGRTPESSELTVRTLGGIVGDVGQVVPGEARLVQGEPSVAFLAKVTDGLFAVTGMAQGHFRLLGDDRGSLRLRGAQSLEIVGLDASSAVRRLHGLTVAEAEGLVRKELRGAH